jgi:hypothetical protein
MWVFLNDCFFSVIQHNKDPDLVLIRGRIKGDLDKLKKNHLPNLGEIVETPTGADYPYRALAWKVEYAEAVKKAALGINYTNFKSSVKDHPRHMLYMDVWSTMKNGEATMRRLRDEDLRPKHQKGKEKQTSFYDRDFDPLYGTGYSESLDLEASRNARDKRLETRDAQKRACKAEAEKSRKHLELVIAKQLRGGPDDFDKEFIVPGTDRELDEEEDSAAPGQWDRTSESILETSGRSGLDTDD